MKSGIIIAQPSGGEELKTVAKSVLSIMVIGPALLLMFVSSRPVFAQAPPSKRADIEKFAFDLHEGVKHGNLTHAQKEQLRTDLQHLREARQNHDRLEGFRAMRNFNELLDSGAFRPEDQQKIKQDMKELREAREHSSGI